VQLERNDAAWEDIERAAKLISNADVSKLAGVIAVRRQQFPVARVKFEEAQRQNGMDCEVPFYLGTVLVEERDWAGAAEALITAADCFDRSQGVIEGQIARIHAASVSGPSSARQAKQIARREQQLAAEARMRATSWFNTAAAWFNLSRYADAKRYALRVVDDPQFGDRARVLLSRLPTAGDERGP